MKNLLILFGGQSSEHTVSRRSAASMIPYVDRDAFAVHIVGITRNGEWYLTPAEPEDIASGAWENHPGNVPAMLSPNRKYPGLLLIRENGTESLPVDCAFPVMHGELCEDGAMQGLMEMCGIPYVGPNICASACCMDKSMTKLVAAAAGVRQADFCLVTDADLEQDEAAAIDGVEKHFAGVYPLFVKPASAGSSVGVSKAYDRQQLTDALKKAADVCSKVLVEETIVGREVEVAVLGNKEIAASVVGEVLAANDFYDFDAKYENAASRTVIPAQISREDSDNLRAAALRVYRSMGCEGMSRVDFFLQADGGIVFNEINTLPGFTKISMYPKLWEATGLPYSQLLTRLCELAMERGTIM